MKKPINTFIAATLVACATFSLPSLAGEQHMNISNKEKAVALLNSIETGNSKAIGYVNPEKYIQHNLSVGDGLSGFGAVLQALPKGSAKVNVVRVFEDGEYVFTHTDYNFFGQQKLVLTYLDSKKVK